MHSKVIVASLVCMLAASFNAGKGVNANIARATKMEINETSGCNAPNEERFGIQTSGYVVASNDTTSFNFDGIGRAHMLNGFGVIQDSSNLFQSLYYQQVFQGGDRVGAMISTPSSNGENCIKFGMDGKVMVVVYLYTQGAYTAISDKSFNDARSKYFLEVIATDAEKAYFPEEDLPGGGGGGGTLPPYPHTNYLNSNFAGVKTGGKGIGDIYINPDLPIHTLATSRFDAIKHYSDFVYGGSDIQTARTTKKKKASESNYGVDINIHVKWLDEDGYEYPVEGIRMDILSRGDTLIRQIAYDWTFIPRTDENGDFTYHIAQNDIGNIKLDSLQLELYADTLATTVYDNHNFRYPYFYGESSLQMSYAVTDIKLSTLKKVDYNITMYPNRSDRAAAYEITQAHHVMQRYVNRFTTGVYHAKTKYPTIQTMYRPQNSNGESEIRIRKDHYNCWDVVNHEYAHFATEYLGLVTLPYNPTPHLYNESCSESEAYAEGLATYLSLASQLWWAEEYEDSYCAEMADYYYDDDANGFYVDYSEYQYGEPDSEHGLDIEGSVTSAMMKFFDEEYRQGDNIALGHSLIWDLIEETGTGIRKFSTFINKMVQAYHSDMADIYTILDNEDIYHEPIPQTARWTIMVYACGGQAESNQGFVSNAISEILSAQGQPSDVNIIIQTGGCNYWQNYNIPTNRIGRYTVRNNQLVQYSLSAGNSNMGDEATFENFLKWGFDKFPAENVGVVMLGDGGALNGVCFDQNYPVNVNSYDYEGNDGLTSSEMSMALSNAMEAYDIEGKLEFIGYDAYCMQVQDVAEFNAPYFKYMVGQQSFIDDPCWRYQNWLEDLYDDEDTVTILETLVDSSLHGTYSERAFSILDLSKMNGYLSAFQNLSMSIVATIHNANDFNYFVSLIESAPLSYHQNNEYYRFGSRDVYGVLMALKQDSYYRNLTQQINAVLSYFPSQYNYNYDEGHTIAASNGLVMYSATTCGYGGSLPCAHGLALHADVNDYDEIGYPANETHFTLWRSIFTMGLGF